MIKFHLENKIENDSNIVHLQNESVKTLIKI